MEVERERVLERDDNVEEGRNYIEGGEIEGQVKMKETGGQVKEILWEGAAGKG